MGRYGKKTRLNPPEVIERAIRHFGEGGLGLEMVERTQEMVCFEGGGGHVTITACENDGTDVDLETREWDYQVREFMGRL
ncbi:hypothetical protein AC482_02425 [miscellaneous Crenarchaeota group-15 archaeon DG-45]|uniref:Uncharacterized protein n=1 Tax=miscellaneous Crenarchaeota group-15 archaeon DG-45 TaxID=1685127 RepID=A0A0M0BRC4_9ARCH|nr:MAG: hypothetical protein AC482_02425 [miscellaneous Crenarchaeota group-15 archaeon DG-45]